MSDRPAGGEAQSDEDLAAAWGAETDAAEGQPAAAEAAADAATEAAV